MTGTRLALSLLFCAFAPVLAHACDAEAVELRHDGSLVRFEVEIADTAEERARGLMFRESMPYLSGMLFIYDRPQPVSFWMKNTLIPLDMLFLDETGIVRRIAPMTTPLSTDGVPGGDGIRMVLEINGGVAEALGIAEGAQMRHPAIDQAIATWPCDAD